MTWAQTVARAFDEGAEYLGVPGLQRTNGLAEQTIKELRRYIKTMDSFKSDEGSLHFMVIWRVWRNMRSQMNKERAGLVHHGRRKIKIRHAHPQSA